jgi:ribosome biogenesis protein BMS1
MDDRPKKAHRPAQAGTKADKKKEKGKAKAGHEKGFNEKVEVQN